jgi:hypothetical protein
MIQGMTTLYRIKYKVVEGKLTSSGVRVVEKPIDQYIEFIRKTHPDAEIVYLELIEEFEQEEPEESGTAKESVIILGINGLPILNISHEPIF